MLIRGHDLVSLNIVPSLQPTESEDFSPVQIPAEPIRDSYSKLRRTLENLSESYHSEFLTKLISQATDKIDRYKPVQHHKLRADDIVLLVEKHLKPSSYSLGLVQAVQENSLGEVTAATVIPNSVPAATDAAEGVPAEPQLSAGAPAARTGPPHTRRAAAALATERTRTLHSEDLI
jgi:hypothetical protein